MSDLVRFSVSIPADLAETFDALILRKGYQSRSEAIRDVMRDYFVEREWDNSHSDVVGTVTIIYNHESSELGQTLTELQHHHHERIICTTHIHLDEHNCLEVIIVKGQSDEIQNIADKLISMKGVKHGKLVCTTTGHNLS